MAEKAIILCGEQCVDKALWDLVKLEWFSFLLPKLANQRALSADDPHGRLQGDIAQRIGFGKIRAQVKIESCQPPNSYAGEQRRVLHEFSGFYHAGISELLVPRQADRLSIAGAAGQVVKL